MPRGGYSFVRARSIRRISAVILSMETFEGKSTETVINMVCSSFAHAWFEVTDADWIAQVL